MDPIKCLTVRQPWASWIFGQVESDKLPRVKNVENRTWATDYRGQLAIHAGKTLDTSAALRFDLSFFSFPMGCVIGVVDLVGIVTGHPSPHAEPGLNHWVLARPRRLVEPVPCKGAQGLFEIPGELVAGAAWSIVYSAIGAQFNPPIWGTAAVADIDNTTLDVCKAHGRGFHEWKEGLARADKTGK